MPHKYVAFIRILLSHSLTSCIFPTSSHTCSRLNKCVGHKQSLKFDQISKSIKLNFSQQNFTRTSVYRYKVPRFISSDGYV